MIPVQAFAVRASRWGLVAAVSLMCGAGCFAPAEEAVDSNSPLVPQGCVVTAVTRLGGTPPASLFGAPVWFSGGASLDPGLYRLENRGGCMRYGAGQNWTSNAYANGDVSWWIIGSTTSARLLIPPGTVGFERVPGSVDRDVGSFSDFAQCDAANRAVPPLDFGFAGGKLGLYLRDDIYEDNSEGEDGKNPYWSLSVISTSCP